MNGSLKRMMAALVCVAFLGSGCFGPFRLVREVYDFNLEATSDKWGREFLFVVLVVVPVYGFAAMADAIVFNSIEFWTGENPVRQVGAATGAPVRRLEVEGAELTMSLRPDRRIEVEIRSPDGERRHFLLERTRHGVVARSPGGRLLAAAPGARVR